MYMYMYMYMLTNSLPVIPSFMVHPLSDNFNGRLSTVHLQCWHVEIIDEEHKFFTKWRTKYPFTTFIKFRINNILDTQIAVLQSITFINNNYTCIVLYMLYMYVSVLVFDWLMF